MGDCDQPGLEPGLPDDWETGLCLPELLQCSMSSRPALLWNLLALFTTLVDVCVLTVAPPTNSMHLIRHTYAIQIYLFILISIHLHHHKSIGVYIFHSTG